MTEADYEGAEHKALQTLGRFAIKDPPVDPVAICTHFGIDVKIVPFPKERGAISGFIHVRDGRKSIYVNKDDINVRQAFTISHELGHYLLHQDWLNTADYKVLYRNTGLSGVDVKEQEANAFAAHLLVPKFMLDRIRKMTTFTSLLVVFGVSRDVMTRQLKRTY